jgi:hypothetical protein
MMRYEFRAKMWLYPGKAGWRFITLPKKASRGIRKLTAGMTRGFGSVRVAATIGSTKTSIFPDTKSDAFLLPIKADVRKREDLEDDCAIVVVIELDA